MSGQPVLLTSGPSGIGRATATAIHGLGADVAITSRSLDGAISVATEIESAHDGDGSVTGATLDTSDSAPSPTWSTNEDGVSLRRGVDQ